MRGLTKCLPATSFNCLLRAGSAPLAAPSSPLSEQYSNRWFSLWKTTVQYSVCWFLRSVRFFFFFLNVGHSLTGKSQTLKTTTINYISQLKRGDKGCFLANIRSREEINKGSWKCTVAQQDKQASWPLSSISLLNIWCRDGWIMDDAYRK